MRSGIIAVVLVLICTVLVTEHASADPDVWATGSAWLATDPAHIGLWEYCYEVCWAGLPHGVSHVDFLLCLLAECECACEPGYFAFADTAGSGDGTLNGGSCTVYYQGMFSCDGDPSIGIDLPVVKFEPYEDDCEPDVDGCAYLCFFSIGAPVPATSCDFTAIKFGTEFATGLVEGVLPSCDTAFSGAEASTWSGIKALYH
jgi:hypothetical protein